MSSQNLEPVEVPAGTEITIGADEWVGGTEPLRLRVHQVRWDLSQYYDGQVWVEGHRLDNGRLPVGPVQVLVSTDALRRSLAMTTEPSAPGPAPQPRCSQRCHVPLLWRDGIGWTHLGTDSVCVPAETVAHDTDRATAGRDAV
jgi:hypothetical protein